jgi:hypothetical protein
MEWFSHNSRLTDQYMGRVSDMAAGAIPCESREKSDTAFD